MDDKIYSLLGHITHPKFTSWNCSALEGCLRQSSEPLEILQISTIYNYVSCNHLDYVMLIDEALEGSMFYDLRIISEQIARMDPK